MSDRPTSVDSPLPPVSGRPVRSAVVLGGSLAGLLAARALVEFADRVTVVERDVLPDGPEPRRNLPQARHVHVLWSGGARAVEELVPGVGELLLDAGAHRLAVTTDMVALAPQGWFRRWDESHHVFLCGRDLLDATVRAQVLDDDRVKLVEHAEVLGLEGTAEAVTGVRVRGADGSRSTLHADLVVDATGRASRTPHWLRELGLPEPPRRVVDSGLAYASRIYRAPEPARRSYPMVNVQADPRAARPGRAGVLAPVEDGCWLVSLSGTRGCEPPTDGAEFTRFAREELRHPVIAELLAGAEPLTGVSVTRTTSNRRHFYERMPAWPENFAVIGDALAAYNPIYGHGMSVAAQSAVALRDVIRRQGWGTPGLSRRVQKAVARPVAAAWDLATSQDIFYPGATEHGPTLRDRVLAAYVGRLMRTAAGNGRIARRVTDVTSLERGAEVLLAPSVLLAAAIGPLKPPLSGPPLRPEEWKAVE
ncbi:NAD(P)/FAD-dependent oxidoreductase [Streptomyces sp. WI04-05B]|uniref:NAD(P)/FAD-dependent oxidoreductase n=1 Tax=Streptomyces TaxID=1883 RepID=UPI0029AD5321|nr:MULTISPECIES: pyridine nucleotide-disulfide oxidoreductase [unclassified Streptomyces]MDX2540479.1 pyridine nucleotide-disulfide oxidoreductase [Streptomyces sp. WI04-05B]MDX2585088.1 pyridine nucleotide-disulfide oxidoreductase [Streptomyces sp. WI04-05A]